MNLPTPEPTPLTKISTYTIINLNKDSNFDIFTSPPTTLQTPTPIPLSTPKPKMSSIITSSEPLTSLLKLIPYLEKTSPPAYNLTSSSSPHSILPPTSLLTPILMSPPMPLPTIF